MQVLCQTKGNCSVSCRTPQAARVCVFFWEVLGWERGVGSGCREELHKAGHGQAPVLHTGPGKAGVSPPTLVTTTCQTMPRKHIKNSYQSGSKTSK